MDEDEVREAAKIYRKESSRPLNEYQKQINEAAQDICLKNPTMLRNRARLLEAAREVVDSTYTFKKGKSRSKKFMTSGPAPAKRRKLNKEYREHRMKELEDELKNVSERIAYKEKRREACEGVRNYKTCDEITEEIGELKKQQQVLQAEFRELSKRDKKSKWYTQKKVSKMSSISSGGESASDTFRKISPSPIPISDSSLVSDNDHISDDQRRRSVSILSDESDQDPHF